MWCSIQFAEVPSTPGVSQYWNTYQAADAWREPHSHPRMTVQDAYAMWFCTGGIFSADL